MTTFVTTSFVWNLQIGEKRPRDLGKKQRYPRRVCRPFATPQPATDGNSLLHDASSFGPLRAVSER